MKDEDLHAFVADARAQAAAAARRRTRWLHRQFREDLTLARVYDDLVRMHAPVELTLIGGRTRSGRLVGAAVDVVVLSHVDGGDVHVATRAVLALRMLAPAAGCPDVTSTAEPPRPTPLLADVLADLADERAHVQIGTAAHVYEGTLGGIARDFVWFDEGARCLCLDAITDVVRL